MKYKKKKKKKKNSVVVIWVKQIQTDFMVEIYFKSLVRANIYW